MRKHIKIPSMTIALILVVLLSSCSDPQDDKQGDQKENPGDVSVNEIQQQAKLWLDKASDCVKEIEDPEDKAGVLAKIAEAQAKAGLYSEALLTAGSIKKAVYKAWALREIAEAQAKEGKLDALKSVFARIQKESAFVRAAYCIGAADGLTEKSQPEKSSPED